MAGPGEAPARAAGGRAAGSILLLSRKSGVTSGYASKIGSHASGPGGSFAAASIISSRVGLGSLPSERDLLQIRVLRVVGRGRDGAARRLLPRRACRRRHSSQHGICVPRHFCREVIIIHLAFTAARAPAVSSSRTRRIAELQAGSPGLGQRAWSRLGRLPPHREGSVRWSTRRNTRDTRNTLTRVRMQRPVSGAAKGQRHEWRDGMALASWPPL